MLPILWMEGRTTADPELRFTQGGKAVCSFTIVNQDRRKNEQSNEWEDAGDPLFVRVSVWDALAENVAESVRKGDLLVVQGKLTNRKWEDKEGNARLSLEMTAKIVAASLQFRTIKHGQTRAQSAPQADDPWVGSPTGGSDEPPF